MGVVYLAEQDEPVHREVAVKVLRAGTHTNEIVARFESERHALALMDHPNITRVYDAGVTDDGLPYFVMERVVGVPITEYATSHRLSTDDRVRLLIQVCRAIQHAHQKGIIHRDVKPSNILVAEVDGQPLCKVIDFGIAKAILSSHGDLRLTATGMIVGTPAYMSPEQFMSDGQDIDTRSDIFSLGIVLYELLAGVLPFDPDLNSGWRSIMAKRSSGDVPPPSLQYAALEMQRRADLALERSTDPEALRRIISGDLDSIVLKSLESDRELRYSTVSAFAADLEHYLRNEPVSAHQISAVYRLRKFARRHRAAVAFTTVLALLLVIMAVGATVQARRLAIANATARARQAQAEQLIGFMIGDLSDRLQPIGKLDLLDEVGKKALAYFEAVPESELSDVELWRRSMAFQQFGNVRLTQGKLPEASQLMQRAIAVSVPLAARDSLNSRWQLALAHAHYNAGAVEWQRGNVDGALGHFEPFVRISDRLMSHYRDSLSFRAEVAYALNNIGQAHEAKGDVPGALERYRAALGILDSIVPRDTMKWEWMLTLGVVHNAAGVAERKLGDLDRAFVDHSAELAVKQRLLRRDPENRDWQRAFAIARTYLSDMWLWQGNAGAALAELDSAHAIYAALVAHDTTNVTWRSGLANNEQRIGDVLLERGDAAGALRMLDDASRQLTVLMPKNAGNTSVQRTEAMTRNSRARALMRLGRTGEASTLIARTIQEGEATIAAKPGDLSRRRILADSYLVQGDLLSQPGSSGGTTAWARALVLVDSLARASKETEYLSIQAGSMLRLGGSADAKPVVDELMKRGFKKPSFVELARTKGFSGK